MNWIADRTLALASLWVPRHRRTEWREEWSAELAALRSVRASGATGLPSELSFVLGALPHAMWMRTEGWTMDSLKQDLKYATRVLRRSPGFTIIAALTLALGIGANASIFSLVNGLLFRAPAGIQQPTRLVQIARSYEERPRWDNFSWPAMELIQEQATVFSGVAGYSGQSFTLGQGAEAERVFGEEVSGNYFDVLGVTPFMGRLLRPDDNVTPGGHPLAVLSHDLWVRRFGADPDIVGATIRIASSPWEVVGVAPAGFTGVEAIGAPPEMWVPSMQRPGIHETLPFDMWGRSWISLVGRLDDGVSYQEAEAAMGVVSSRLREASPINDDMTVLLAQGIGLDPEGRTEARGLAAILALIVGIVLLITCTNVANLLLARATGRRLEVGVRTALGAGRRRIMQQMVAESLVLSAFATLLAVPIVLSADRFLPLIFPYTLSVSVGADPTVLGFLALVGLGAGLLFGVAPAWAVTRRDLQSTLREAGTTGGRTRTRMRDGLVVVQLGLSLGLVACAALLGRSVMKASTAQPGFDPAGLVVGVVDIQSLGRYTDEESRQLLARLVRAVEDAPGVAQATVANSAPIYGGHARSSARPVGRDDVFYEAEYNIVGGDYFATMGIPIVQGRPLGGLEEEAEQVVVINESLARMFWPGEDPIGRRLQGDPEWRVVGVVPDVQMRSLRSEGRPGVYYPLAHASPVMVIHARGIDGRPPASEAIEAAVARVDPGMPVRVTDLQGAIASSMGETRTIGALIGVFAALALVLAAVGLYGLVSYGASQRVREMGIRIALGARPESLVGLILKKGILIACAGIVVGILVSSGLSQALRSLLFQVEPNDPVILGAAAVGLLAIASLAAWFPARRASRVDAAISLRD